jgi:tetratricopeptide (TPR) repeat protein
MRRAPSDADYPRSVFATFQEQIASAEIEAPGVAALLALAAFVAPDAIPEELFQQAPEVYPEELQPTLLQVATPARDLRATIAAALEVDEALGVLNDLSMIDFAPLSRTFSIHGLVQAAARDLLGGAKARWVAAAVAALNAAFPDVEFTNWDRCERLLPHAQRVAQFVADFHIDSGTAGRLLIRTAYYLYERGRYAEAQPLYERALAICEKALGPDHPDVTTSLNNLAALYDSQGRYGEAQPLFERALAIREKALGRDHPDVATSLNNLAALHRAQGRYGEAQPLFERALAIWEKALGPDHPDVAQSLNNLAELHRAQGRYGQAQLLSERALAIWEKALGPDHPNVATSLNNLAALHRAQSRYGEAQPLYERALAIREKALGPDHLNVAQSLNNLALLYYAQGRYAEAQPLSERALAIWEKALGPDHPDVAQSLNNLAAALRARAAGDDGDRSG